MSRLFPLPADLPDDLLLDAPAEIERGERWLRAHMERTGMRRLILGLSGGIDSSVVALWAGSALGAEAITLVAMPYGLLEDSRWPASTLDSLADARRVAARMPGARMLEIDIAPQVDAAARQMGLDQRLDANPDDRRAALALGNLKARSRANLLYGIANLAGDTLVLGTENLSEWFTGYFTRGGDALSDLELLAPFTKTEVRQLAAHLGVPSRVLAKAPSADLWQGQSDEGELGFRYHDLDRAIVACGRDPARATLPLLAAHLGEPLAAPILARIHASAHKRADTPKFPREAP
jgi:NAD+ synthase